MRVLDVDLDAEPAGHIDLLAADAGGALAVVVIAAEEPDAALLRLVDQCAWVMDRAALLKRLHGLIDDDEAPSGGSVVRGILIASAFGETFRRRLTLLSVPVVPILARRGRSAQGDVLLVEPLAAVLGLETTAELETTTEEDRPARVERRLRVRSIAPANGHNDARAPVASAIAGEPDGAPADETADGRHDASALVSAEDAPDPFVAGLMGVPADTDSDGERLEAIPFSLDGDLLDEALLPAALPPAGRDRGPMFFAHAAGAHAVAADASSPLSPSAPAVAGAPAPAAPPSAAAPPPFATPAPPPFAAAPTPPFSSAPPSTEAAAETFEPLSPEEMAEFERFDRMRREGGPGGPP